MTTFWWILLGGLAMRAIALVGSVTLILREATLEKILLPLVSFAAGSLVGGALFHGQGTARGGRPRQASWLHG